jgi:hypothetical protein
VYDSSPKLSLEPKTKILRRESNGEELHINDVPRAGVRKDNYNGNYRAKGKYIKPQSTTVKFQGTKRIQSTYSPS